MLLGIGLVLVFGESEVAPPLARGAPAPQIDLPLLGGEGRVSLAELRGRVVLLNFWATWCKPCEDEMPAMERLYRGLRGEDFELVAVSVDEEKEVVRRFRERLDLSFPIALDPDREAARRYQTTGFPESILIDRGGRVVERYVGPRDWDHPIYARRIRELASGPDAVEAARSPEPEGGGA